LTKELKINFNSDSSALKSNKMMSMEFSKKSKVKPLSSPDEESFKQLLKHNCLFYVLPPRIDISLSEFETLGEFEIH
jgi:hypothetical protein